MQIRGLGSSLRLGGMALVLLGGVSGAQAGFFERLFGTESEPEQPRQYQPAPAQDEVIDVQPGRRRSLDFSVRPRRERAVRRERPRREPRNSVETAGLPTGPIDPAQNPEWHLQDPTLRRGDIVVLETEVLVFQGGRMPFSRANFSSLQESDLPKDERDRLSHMAGLKPVSPPRTTVASVSQ
jgi:hypothetical protein